jgi:hypothetical protein
MHSINFGILLTFYRKAQLLSIDGTGALRKGRKNKLRKLATNPAHCLPLVQSHFCWRLRNRVILFLIEADLF